jgi:hypothetical protein
VTGATALVLVLIGLAVLVGEIVRLRAAVSGARTARPEPADGARKPAGAAASNLPSRSPQVPSPASPGGQAPAPASAPDADVPTFKTYGTRVRFVDSPTDAARLALRQHKLLFVLHVAGYFEDAKFT